MKMKNLGLVLFVIFLLVVVFLFYRSNQIGDRQYKEGYSGIVQQVNKSVQGYHTAVFANGNEVILDVYRSCLSDFIREGDSLYKAPASWELHIYRRKSHGYELVKICDHE